MLGWICCFFLWFVFWIMLECLYRIIQAKELYEKVFGLLYVLVCVLTISLMFGML